MSEPLSHNTRAFQTSARSRRRVVKPKKWLTALLLVLLLLIAAAFFFVIRYTLKKGQNPPESTAAGAADPVSRTMTEAFPSETGFLRLQRDLQREGLILPDPAAA
ncbi:MAG: hypothetical protein J5496_07310 [Lachnospiraceae bacterium]|nr:hypothetical protein [Lachnospiraceae bacterium]